MSTASCPVPHSGTGGLTHIPGQWLSDCRCCSRQGLSFSLKPSFKERVSKCALWFHSVTRRVCFVLFSSHPTGSISEAKHLWFLCFNCGKVDDVVESFLDLSILNVFIGNISDFVVLKSLSGDTEFYFENLTWCTMPFSCLTYCLAWSALHRLMQLWSPSIKNRLVRNLRRAEGRAASGVLLGCSWWKHEHRQELLRSAPATVSRLWRSHDGPAEIWGLFPSVLGERWGRQSDVAMVFTNMPLDLVR